MLTPFESDHAAFSNAAHLTAERILYPRLFGTAPQFITFRKADTSTSRGRILDCDLAIDYECMVDVPGLKAPLVTTIQERWREMKYFVGYGSQITITEWNHLSDQPSELHKLCAQIVVYGFYDHNADEIVKAVAVSSFGLMRAIIEKRIKFTRWLNRKQQSFLSFEIGDLRSLALLWHEYDQAYEEDLAKLDAELLSEMSFNPDDYDFF